MTGLPWDASYHDGPAPWDTGRPQPTIVRLASEGGFTGAVLDAGCGTGENALHLAALGLPVLGVDVAATAVSIAREKAAARGVEAEFVLADALDIARPGRRFRTVLDCGRPGYVAALASVTEPGGRLHLLCFSDEGPDTGPHPVSRGELAAGIAGAGLKVATIAPERLRTRFHAEDGAPAWLATIGRV
jgi:SAM-dependent methyltransferase